MTGNCNSLITSLYNHYRQVLAYHLYCILLDKNGEVDRKDIVHKSLNCLYSLLMVVYVKDWSRKHLK